MHLLRLLAASIVLCIAALPLGAQPRIAPLHAPGDVTIYASLIYADDWDASWLASSDKHYGVHAISPTAPSFAPVSPYSTYLNAIGGGFYRDGHYYCMSYWTSMGYYYVTTLSEWDATTWELLRTTRTELDEVASDMTYDPITDKVYGCFMKQGSANGSYSYEWGTLNTETAKREIIGSLPERLGAVAADGKGAIYGIGATGSLYSIEPASGKLTRIGMTGHASYHLGSGVIDERTGDFYWFCYPNASDSYLFRVDTSTAECTLIYELPKNEEFCGAYILPPAAKASAPDVVTDLAALFEGESLTGTISFTLPTVDYAGQPLSGTLTYTVEANGEAFTMGTAAPGESVSATYTAPKGQESYTFTAYADNGEKGASNSVTFWVGGDAPCPVTDVRIARNADKSISISWTAPTATVHGGNMLGLSYKVVRQPDGATIVERTTETSAIDRHVPVSGDAEKFSYIIVPYNGSYAGKSVTSDEISVGTTTLPYVQGFDSRDDFNLMTVIDANHDGMTWEWHQLAGGSKECTATCNTPERTPQDDWLITPGLDLRPGILYRVSFYPTCRYNLYKQKLAVAIGTETDAATMTRELIPAATSTIYPWFATTIQGDGWYSTWNITSKGLAPYSLPYDEDGGMAQCSLSEVGDCVRYATPLLTLRGSHKPLLEFYYYYDQNSHDQLSVDISCEGGDYTQLLVIDYATQEGENGWRKAAIDLSAYTDAENVQVGFVGKKYDSEHHSLQIDHISIREHLSCDLAITGIHAPRMMQAGDENAVTVTVGNVGTSEVENAEVVLYRDERQAATASVKYLAAGSEETVTLFVTPEVNAPEVSSFYAEVVVDGDADLSNNRSTTVQTHNKRSLLPAVNDLAYEWEDEAASEDVPRTARLSWSEPDLEGKTGVLLLDDFEGYEPFVIEHIGDWTLYDGTRAYTYGVNGATYPNAYAPAAFQVFNPSKAGVTTEYWKPFSGDQILVSFDAATYDPTDPFAPVPQTDHWLISPLLPTMPQTVSFRTRSITTTYGIETFQLLYNTSETTDPATFKVIPATPFEAPATWTEITFRLPDNARHFAIRHNSHNVYALLIDDIVYRSAEAVPAQLSLVGYNLYQDGQRLNSETIDDNGYSIAFAPKESINHDYNVTALYVEGESAFSNTVNTSVPMGIETVQVSKPTTSDVSFDFLGRHVKTGGQHRAVPSVIINDGKKLKY